MTKVAIAGCGLIAGGPLREGRPIATNHAGACRATGCSLVGAADMDAARRETFGAYWAVPTFASVDAMLAATRPDILVVATPQETHLHVCEAGIAAGVRGILCEKPLSGHASTARRIVDAARIARVPLAVNFTRRWDLTHHDLRERVRVGALGDLVSVLGTYTGTLRGNGSHMVDTVRMLAAPGPWDIGWSSALPAGADDGPVAATVSSGTCVVHIAPVVGAQYFVFEIQLIGTRGRARLLLGGNDVRVDLPAPSPQYPGYKYLLDERPLPKDTLPQAFANALAALAAATRGEAPLPYDAEEHLGTLETIERLTQHATSPS